MRLLKAKAHFLSPYRPQSQISTLRITGQPLPPPRHLHLPALPVTEMVYANIILFILKTPVSVTLGGSAILARFLSQIALSYKTSRRES